MDPISDTFSALADPTRRAILARLAMGASSVTDLAAPFDMSMPAISKHLRVLEHAGLIERSREAQFRPCRLRADPLQQAAMWLEQYRQFWEESFDRLDDYLQRLQSERNSSPPELAGRPKAARPATPTTKKTTSKNRQEKRNGNQPA